MAGTVFIRTCVLNCVCLAVLLTGCTIPNGGSRNNSVNATADTATNATPKLKLKNPSNLHLTYAKWQEQIGNLKEARESYEFVLGEEPKSADAILGLARLDQLAGHTRAAEQGFLQALKAYPKNPHVLHTVGQFYVAQDRWDEAVKLLNTAMKSAPADKMIRYHLAVALAQTGDVDSAKPHFEKIVGDAEAHYNIGLLLYERGQLESSKKHFLQAVIKNPELEQAQFWFDEVRQEQDAKFILTGSNNLKGAQPRYEELPPPPSSVSNNPDPDRRDTTPIAQNQSQNTNVFRNSQSLSQSAAAQQEYPAAGNRFLPPSVDRTPPRKKSFISQSQTASPPTLTPEQSEQRKNQVRLSNGH